MTFALRPLSLVALLAIAPASVGAAKTPARERPAKGLQRALRPLGRAAANLRLEARDLNVKARFKLLDVRDEIGAKPRQLGGLVGKVIGGAFRKVARFLPGKGRIAGRADGEFDRAMFHFINGRNNLQSFATADLEEIVKGSVGDTRTVHLVQMATLADPVAHRFKVVNGQKTDLGQVEGVNFGSPDDAHAFFTWATNASVRGRKPLVSAKQYDFSMWDHGGAHSGDMFDDKTATHIPLSQYGRSFPDFGDRRGLHVADLCFGGNVEHVAALFGGTRSGKPAARVYVASEETEPGAGHDYTGVGKIYTQNPGMDVRAQGKAWVQSYVASYNGGSQGVSAVQSAALDVEGIQHLVPRLRLFSQELVAAAKNGEKPLLKTSAAGAQHFALSTQRDLYDFARLVASSTKRPSLQTAAKEVMEFLDGKVVIYNEISPGDQRHANAHGLAIWLPTPVALRQDAKLLEKISLGKPPHAYQGYRIAMWPSALVQSARRFAPEDYGNTTFAKLVPEWAEFTQMLLERSVKALRR